YVPDRTSDLTDRELFAKGRDAINEERRRVMAEFYGGKLAEARPDAPAPVKVADASEVVPWVSMIEPWKKWRKSNGKATPRRAEDAMRRTMKRLFAFLSEYHGDMGPVKP